MKKYTIKKITTISILVAICVAISIIDSLISGLIIPFMPGVKLGLSNVIILIILYQYRFDVGLVVTIIKSIIVGLLFSGITTFIIGGTASLVSFLLMYLAKRLLKDNVSTVSISLIGGLSHILMQLLIVSLIYKLGSVVFLYGVYLILISIGTSIIVGLVSIKCNNLMTKINERYENER